MFTQKIKQFIQTESTKKEYDYHIPLQPFIRRFSIYSIFIFITMGIIGLYLYNGIDYTMYLVSISLTFGYYFAHSNYEKKFRLKNKIRYHIINRSTISTFKIIEFFTIFNLAVGYIIYNSVMPLHFYIISLAFLVIIFTIELIIQKNIRKLGYQFEDLMNYQNTTIIVLLFTFHLLFFLLIPSNVFMKSFHIVYFLSVLLFFLHGTVKPKKMKLNNNLVTLLSISLFLLVVIITIPSKGTYNSFLYRAERVNDYSLKIDNVEEFYTVENKIYIKDNNTLYILTADLDYKNQIELEEGMSLKYTTKDLWVIKQLTPTNIQVYTVDKEQYTLEESHTITLTENIINNLENYTFFDVLELDKETNNVYLINRTNHTIFYEVTTPNNDNESTLILHDKDSGKNVHSPVLEIESTNYGHSLKYTKFSNHSTDSFMYAYVYHNYSYYLRGILHESYSPFIPEDTTHVSYSEIEKYGGIYDTYIPNTEEVLYYYHLSESRYDIDHFITINKSIDVENLYHLRCINSDSSLLSELDFYADSVFISPENDIVYYTNKTSDGTTISRTSFWGNEESYSPTYKRSFNYNDDPMSITNVPPTIFFILLLFVSFTLLSSVPTLYKDEKHIKEYKKNKHIKITANILTILFIIESIVSSFGVKFTLEIWINFSLGLILLYLALLFYFIYVIGFYNQKIKWFMLTLGLIFITMILIYTRQNGGMYKHKGENIYTIRSGFLDYDTTYYHKENILFTKRIVSVSDFELEMVTISENKITITYDDLKSEIYYLNNKE